MKTKKILIGAGILVTVVVVYRVFSRRRRRKKIKVRIADEGYETAEDILFHRRGLLRPGRALF